jgi:hypothetical protein
MVKWLNVGKRQQGPGVGIRLLILVFEYPHFPENYLSSVPVLDLLSTPVTEVHEVRAARSMVLSPTAEKCPSRAVISSMAI